MNPFDDPLKGLREKEPPVVEGFICPECMKKYATMTELIRHVERKHSTEEQQGSVLCRDKSTGSKTSLFGKFRKKGFSNDAQAATVKNDALERTAAFRRNNYDPSTVEEPNSKESLNLPSLNENFVFSCESDDEGDLAKPAAHQETTTQRTGIRRSHWDFFKQHRDNRTERNELLTNKLIIRLNRILTRYPELDDFYKRKTHEQTVVQWVPANLVANCPICTAKFGLLFGNAGGRHHCRLCGCVLCFRCSKFYSFEFAHKLVAPAGMKPKVPMMKTKKPGMNLTSVGKVLSYLNFELNPELDPTHWDQLRICLPCDHLLSIRSGKLQLPTAFSIAQTYSLISQLKEDIGKSAEVYTEMARSLRRGEQDYKLIDAKRLHVEIGVLCCQVNQASEKIARMNLCADSPTDDPEVLEARQSLAQRNALIQANIRRSIVAWYQRYALALPAIPSDKDYEVLKVKHEERIQRRINREKAILLNEQTELQRFGKGNKSKTDSKELVKEASRLNEVAILHQAGFSCSSVDYRVNPMDNPFQQQINLLKHYINEARVAKRFDEVATLEQSLKELEIEQYFVQLDDVSQMPSSDTQAETSESQGNVVKNNLNPFDLDLDSFNESSRHDEQHFNSTAPSWNPFECDNKVSPQRPLESSSKTKSSQITSYQLCSQSAAEDYPVEFDPFA